MRLDVTIMSGIDDGTVLRIMPEEGAALLPDGSWVISIGRHDDNGVCLRNDTFASRYHARIHYRADGLWLEDCGSTNGTYVETPIEEIQIGQITRIVPGQLFRVGRTWMRVELVG